MRGGVIFEMVLLDGAGRPIVAGMALGASECLEVVSFFAKAIKSVFGETTLFTEERPVEERRVASFRKPPVHAVDANAGVAGTAGATLSGVNGTLDASAVPTGCASEATVAPRPVDKKKATAPPYIQHASLFGEQFYLQFMSDLGPAFESVVRAVFEKYRHRLCLDHRLVRPVQFVAPMRLKSFAFASVLCSPLCAEKCNGAANKTLGQRVDSPLFGDVQSLGFRAYRVCS